MRPIDGDLLNQKITNIAKQLAKSDAQKVLIGRVMYVIEHMPALPQPSNEPLTLKELREMEQSTPVWWDYIPCWVLVRRGSVLAFGSEPHKVENLLGNFYRRPPEGEEDT